MDRLSRVERLVVKKVDVHGDELCEGVVETHVGNADLPSLRHEDVATLVQQQQQPVTCGRL